MLKCTGSGVDASPAEEDDGGGGEQRLDQERKLSRSEELELWKKKRQVGGKGSSALSHTTDKERSLQGLTASQVNLRRTGGSGGIKATNAGVRAVTPTMLSGRRDIGKSLGRCGISRGAGPKSRPSPSGSLDESMGGASEEEYVTPSREQSVEPVMQACAESTRERLQTIASSCVRGAEPSPIPAAADGMRGVSDGRRFSIHVAVDEDDDEVEWRVPVPGDEIALESEVSSIAADLKEHKDEDDEAIPEDLQQQVAASDVQAESDHESQSADGEDVSSELASELASVQDTESADRDEPVPVLDQSKGKHTMQEESLRLDQGAGGSSLFCDAAESGTEVLVSTRSIRCADAQLQEAEAQAVLSGVLLQLPQVDQDKDDGRMDPIAETWMEGVEEDEEQVSMDEVRSKLFDTTSRLARCTALLQRMVEENSQLKGEVAELQVCTFSESRTP